MSSNNVTRTQAGPEFLSSSVRATIDEIPRLSISRHILNPMLIAGAYILASVLFGLRLSGASLILVILTLLILFILYQHGDPYRHWRKGKKTAFARDTLFNWCATFAVVLILGAASGFGHLYDTRVLLTWFIIAPIAQLLGTFTLARTARPAQSSTDIRSFVVIGENDIGARFAAMCDSNPNLYMRMHGYFDDRTIPQQAQNQRHPVLGTMCEMAPYVREHNIKMIFISQPISANPRIHALIDELQNTTASVYFLPDIYTFDLVQARCDNIGGMPVIAICETPLIGINSAIKRASDIAFGIGILLLLTPLMLLIALAVKLSSPGPVIFRQRRYGLYGEQIIVYKFRSMRVLDDGGTIVQASKNDQRVTRLGALLRRCSMDELPQLINVLQGRMSLVGPRPHAVAHNELYRKLIKGYMIRHKVKPGITGWAQVNGLRGETETLDKMQARVKYDLDYLRNWSLWRDFWIILITVRTVLAGENAH